MAWKYVPMTGGMPRTAMGLISMYFLFGVPVSYVFGAPPALIATGAYSTILTLVPTLQKQSMIRALVGAACGALIGTLWFSCIMEANSHAYGWITALGAAVLALRVPARDEHAPARITASGRARLSS